MKTINVKSVNITFHVSNLKKAASFYQNVLGLSKTCEWPTYVVFDVCGTKLGLQLGGKKGDKWGAPDFYLQVDDVDATYANLKDKGIKFVSEPKDQYWGSRTATFLDPDGNRFILVEIPKKNKFPKT